MIITAGQHQGHRDYQEDSFLVVQSEDRFVTVVTLADGMGGLPNGKQASTWAAEITTEELFEGRSVREAIYAADRKLTSAHDGRGSTVTSALIISGTIKIAHCGDTRAYLYSAARDEFEQLTVDQGRGSTLYDFLGKSHYEDKPIYQEIDRKVAVGDVLLLSSDGLHDYISEDFIRDAIIRGLDAESLVLNAWEKISQNTNYADNITAIIVKF